jgi:hypothetical protein
MLVVMVAHKSSEDTHCHQQVLQPPRNAGVRITSQDENESNKKYNNTGDMNEIQIIRFILGYRG